MAEEFERKVENIQIRDEEKITQVVTEIHCKLSFERLVFEAFGIGKDPDEAIRYSNIIREFISNQQNIEIRDLLFSGGKEDREKAAELMVEELHKQETSQKKAA